MACLEGRQQGQGENPFHFHQVLFQQVCAVARSHTVVSPRCHLSDMGRQRSEDIHTDDDATQRGASAAGPGSHREKSISPWWRRGGDDRSADASSDPGWVMMSYAIVGTLPTKLYTGFGN